MCPHYVGYIIAKMYNKVSYWFFESLRKYSIIDGLQICAQAHYISCIVPHALTSSTFSENSHMVEMVLLGKPYSLDSLWSGDFSIWGRQRFFEAIRWKSADTSKTFNQKCFWIQTWFLGHCGSNGGGFLLVIWNDICICN